MNFWFDRWIDGSSPSQLAPDLLKFVKARGAKKRSVAKALLEEQWVKNIRGSLTLQAIVQFMSLWCIIQERPPLSSAEDSFIWSLSKRVVTRRDRRIRLSS